MVTDRIRRLSSYALLKSMFEQGYENYIDCFVGIVLQVFSSDEVLDVESVQRNLDRFFPLPRLMVQQVMDRAQRKGYVHKDKKREGYGLSQKAVREFVDEPKTAANRIDALIEDVESYFREHFFRSDIPTQVLIESFLDNTGFLQSFYDTSRHEDIGNIVETKDQKMLLQYLKSIESEKPQQTATFREIVMGSIVAEALKWTDLQSVKLESFRHCHVFLDTNFVFSILEFHDPQISQPALELYRNLRFFDFRTSVFDFTLEQIREVLRRYSPDNMVAIDSPQRPSVHNTLKSWKWDKKKVEDYIEGLESTLEEKGVTVLPSGMNFVHGRAHDDERLSEFVEVYGGLFERRKPKYGYQSTKFGKQHDLAAIVKIQELRENRSVTLNDPKAIFLTSDRKLAEFDQLDVSRSEQDALPEVVLDTGFTSVLWFLAKGRADINFSLPTIIAAYSRNLFINERVWNRFQAVFKQAVDDEGINVEQVPNVFYATIQNTLNEFSDDDIGLITKSFVEDRMRAAKDEFERQKQQETQSKSTLEQQQGMIDSLQSDNERLRTTKETIEKVSNRRHTTICVLLVLLILLLAVSMLIYLF